ncbi:MAG TPA: dockerin type I domain-containing protein [Sedimentisphaerales bacterium]|nr:dockerin type I domain-containing protein [Sedimentisphaerales bacterium]
MHHQSAAERRLDLDGNGRVDILDAFRLAKGIESRGPTTAEWDVNGDGRIDRDDVDDVAFAAVRLDKGV